MIIERMRHSSNGAVNPAVYDAIREVESRATDEYVAYLQEVGEVSGPNYAACIQPIASLGPDLQPYFGEDDVSCLVLDKETSFDSRTTVFSLATKNGVQRQIIKDHEPEYFEVDETYWHHLGSDMLSELFQPGSYPELAELVTSKGIELLDPQEVGVRLMTTEEHRKTTAIAALSKFTLSHLVHVLALYNTVAYPDRDEAAMRPEELSRLYNDLKQGQSVGLRTGTKYLSCAKHELQTDAPDNLLKTWLHLNYDIRIGPVRLHFNDDIVMAMEFGEQAISFFEQEGIVAS